MTDFTTELRRLIAAAKVDPCPYIKIPGPNAKRDFGDLCLYLINHAEQIAALIEATEHFVKCEPDGVSYEADLKAVGQALKAIHRKDTP